VSESVKFGAPSDDLPRAMIRMKTNQRIAIGAAALVGVALAGAAMVLASYDEGNAPPKGAFRPTLIPERQAASPAKPALATRPSRFAYVPLDLRDQILPPEGIALPPQVEPDEPVDVAADPGTWDVDVERHVLPSPHSDRPPATIKRGPSSRRSGARPMSRSLRERLKQISPSAMPRLVAKFEAAKVSWPPSEIAFVAIKDKKVLELYARSGTDKWNFIHRYRVLAASGASGPKLQRGDRQVPEGVYRISYLNPNSRYHVSLRVNYPNRFDRKMASQDGRRNLGGDIMIHGKNSSAGCLAMGDNAAEELFVLAAEVGLSRIRVIIAPTDLRTSEIPSKRDTPKWLPQLYREIAGAMTEFKAPPKPTLWSLLGLSTR